MRDLRLTDSNDLQFDGKDFSMVKESPAVGQRIKIRLLTLLGEFKWNYLVGVDWFGKVFSTTTSYTEKNGILRNVISKTPGVDSISAFTFGVDRKNRTARMMFVARSIYSDINIKGYLTQIIEEKDGG